MSLASRLQRVILRGFCLFNIREQSILSQVDKCRWKPLCSDKPAFYQFVSESPPLTFAVKKYQFIRSNKVYVRFYFRFFFSPRFVFKLYSIRCREGSPKPSIWITFKLKEIPSFMFGFIDKMAFYWWLSENWFSTNC